SDGRWNCRRARSDRSPSIASLTASWRVDFSRAGIHSEQRYRRDCDELGEYDQLTCCGFHEAPFFDLALHPGEGRNLRPPANGSGKSDRWATLAQFARLGNA